MSATPTPTNAALSAEFLVNIYKPGTVDNIFVTSLPNDVDRGSEPGEKAVTTRLTSAIQRHVEKWDRPKRALYFCVGTIKADARPDPERPGSSVRNKDNISEITSAHSDMDFKSVVETPEQIMAAILALPLPPSVIVNSGRGYHAYWLLSEPTDDFPRVEMVMKQLADLVAGDQQVAHCAALMRLPGSHNTKENGWRPVEVVRDRYDITYELSDLEDMLAVLSPVLTRKEKPRDARGPMESNPFLAVAARLGFKPPIDVEQRLSQMSYGGAGDSAIHATQLSVSASLLARGTPIDEVVDTLLGATQAAAGIDGSNWSWPREERAIRRMCEEWLRKNPAPKKEPTPKADVHALPAPKPRKDASERYGNSHDGNETLGDVVSFDDARARKAKPKAKADAGDAPHVILGQAVIEVMQDRGERLLVTSGQIWRYSDGLWSSPMLDGRRWLDVEVEQGARALGLTSNNRLINETRQWIMRDPDLFQDEVVWDSHGKIPTRSGLIDPDTLEVEPPRADHYTTWRIECDFEPGAQCPRWLRMMEDFFGDRKPDERAATISAIQEIWGMALVEEKSKALTKALVLQGGADSGKTSVLEVLSGLLSESPISMSLDAVGGTHGLMEFTRRAPWVINEAFDQSKWHFSALVKSILTGDPVQINIKNGPLLTQRIRCPVFWGTNHPPQFKEATRAIVNRLVVIKCRQTFHESSPVGTAVEARKAGFSEPSAFVLATEKSGLLNWAIAGLRRAKERGFIQLTAEIEETRAEIRADSNLVDGFFKECVEFSESHMVSTPDFCAAFTVWWQENKGENRGAPSNEAIGKAISSLGDARVISQRDNERRYYVGLKLNPTGLDYWSGAANGSAAQGKTSRISSGSDAVNRLIPSAWDDREPVINMHAEFRKLERAQQAKDRPETGDSWSDSSKPVTATTVTISDPLF